MGQLNFYFLQYSILRLHDVVNSATGALPGQVGTCIVMLVGSYGCVVNGVYRKLSVIYGLGKHQKYIIRGALVYRLGAYEQTCTPLVTPLTSPVAV